MTLNVLVGDKSSSTRRAVKKAAACFISINTSAHIFISQYKSILYTILSLSSYYPSCSVISICPPHFLLSLSISSSFPVCVYVRGLHIMYRCLHPYRCVCVAIIEKISRQPTSLLPLSYSCRLCCFSSPFLLTPLIHHSSSLLTFYLFCRHLPSRASFPSYYSLFLPPVSRVPFPPTALSVDLFLRLHISLHVFLSPRSPIVSPRLFWPLSRSSSISSSLVLSPRRLSLSLSLVSLICFCSSPSTFCFYSPLSHLVFTLLFCRFPSSPPLLPICSYISYCLPPLTSFPSL